METAYTDTIYEVAGLMRDGNDVVVVEEIDLLENFGDYEGETCYWCHIFVKTDELAKKIIAGTNWEPDGMSPAPHLYATTSFSIKGTADEIGLKLEQIV